MKRLIIILMALTFLLILPTLALADFKLEQWQFFKKVQDKGIDKGLDGKQKYALIELDSAIFNESKGDLSDLRLIDNLGQEIPYVLQPNSYLNGDNTIPDEIEYPVRIINNTVVPQKYSSFILDLQKASKEPYNILNINTKSTDFLRMVEIDGSDDQVTWHKITTDKHIFSFQGMSNTRVNFDESNFRYIRVKVWNKGESPLKIDGAQVHYQKIVPLKEKTLSGVNMTQEEDKQNKKSIIKLDLGSRNIPSIQVNFTIPGSNFRRQIQIEGSNDGKAWDYLGDDVVYSIDVDNYKFSKLNIKYNQGHYRFLKFIIANEDNLPLKFTSAKVICHVTTVLFSYELKSNYKLYYGNPKAQAPEYDLKDINNYIKQDSLPNLTLGSQEINPKFNAKTQRPWSEDNSWLLVVVLVGVVGILGIYIIKMMRNINQ